MVGSIRELSAATGKAQRTLRDYTLRGAPREPDGRYCVEEWQAWIAANIRGSHPRGNQPGDEGSRGFWECYKVREQALAEELKRKQLAGELIEVDVVARHSEQRITHAKALLEQIPDRLLGLLPKAVKGDGRKQFRQRAAEMIEDVCFALADEPAKERMQNGEPGVEPADAT